jgi:hypothetical protein
MTRVVLTNKRLLVLVKCSGNFKVGQLVKIDFRRFANVRYQRAGANRRVF